MKKLLHALWLLCLVPPLAMGWWVFRYGVNVPFLDQWFIAPLFLKAEAGRLVLSDLWALHNEHRILFPRLVYLAVGRLSGWNIRAEMLAIFLLALSYAALTWRLGRRTLSGRWAAPVLALVASSLFFSPVQYENWLLGIQVCVHLPVLMLVTALWLTTTNASWPAKATLCAACCFVATYSFGSGMLTWFAVAPALWAGTKPGRRRAALPLFAALGALSVLLYFSHYTMAGEAESQEAAWAHPLQTVGFLLTLLGGHLGFHDRTASLCVGGVSILAFAALWLRALRPRTPATERHHLLVWLGLATYAFLSALAASVQRASFGSGAALSPRYALYGVLFSVGILYALGVWMEARQGRLSRRVLVLAGAACASLLLVLHVESAAAGLDGMRVMSGRLLQGKAALRFCLVLPDERTLTRALYPDFEELVALADELDRAGLIRPPLYRTRDLPDLAVAPADPGGVFDRLERNAAGAWRALGWSRPRWHPSASDVVVLTASGADGKETLCAMARLRRLPGKGKLQWSAEFKPEALPSGAERVTAWGYDGARATYQALGTRPLR